MKNSEMKIERKLFLVVFLVAIAFFSIYAIFDITNLVQMIIETVKGTHVYERLGLRILNMSFDIIECAFFAVASAMLFLREPHNRGEVLLLAVGLYAIINRGIWLIIRIINAISISSAFSALSVVYMITAILQVGAGVAIILLRNRKPTVAKIIGIVSFAVFACGNLSSTISDIVSSIRYGFFSTVSIFEFLAFALDVVVIVALCMMKNEKQAMQVPPETSNQLQN